MKRKSLLLLLIISLISCHRGQGEIVTSSFNNSSSTNSSSSSSIGGDKPSTSTNSSTSHTSSSSSNGNNKTKLYDSKIAPNYPTNYYDTVRGLKGEALKKALHDIIDDHKSFGYSSTQHYYKIVDVNPDNKNEIILFYTGATNISTGYNKEHVWAKSHGDFGTSSPTGSDMHNLHPCNERLNSTRGNLDFAEGGKELTDYNGNNRINGGTSFEPSDDFKGDTARTIFYMAVRYEGDASNEPDLELDAPSSTRYYNFSSGAKGIHGKFDDLYKWATSGQDPVSSYEVNRNNIIYSQYQHNRNPFIDHPEFIQMIYDKEYNGPGALLDNNPASSPKKTDEEIIKEFKDAVDAIGTVTLDSLELIEKAEDLYNEMSDELKNQVTSYYQTLVNARNAYEKLFKEHAVEATIKAIDAIGEVTLNSKEAIEYAEKLYNELSQEQKSLVTNYQKLVEARNKYNELLGDRKTLLDEKFTNGTNLNNGSYASNKTIKLGNYNIFFSSHGVFSSEFRFGGENPSYVSGISDAADNKNLHYLKINHTFSRLDTITLKTGQKYQNTDKLFFLLSNDNGTTYRSLISFDSFANTTLTYNANNGEFKNCQLVIALAGSKPRLALESITLEGVN